MRELLEGLLILLHNPWQRSLRRFWWTFSLNYLITKLHNVISKTVGQLNKIIKEKIWVTLRNIEDEEKWVRKREELVKEIKENNS